jgi:AcrR family transcriptional regulator
MGRPQLVDVDALLDHAREIWIAEGQAAVTIRALSARSGVSNGAIYHHFSSRNHLLSQIWAREASAFRAFQREQIQDARDHGTAEDAVVAAALSTGGYADVKGAAVRVLLASRPDTITPDGVPDQLIKELRRHRASAATLISDLAEEVWGRSDETARRLMRNCVVDIPARIFMSAERPNSPLARYAIEHAVRGVLAAGPPD